MNSFKFCCIGMIVFLFSCKSAMDKTDNTKDTLSPSVAEQNIPSQTISDTISDDILPGKEEEMVFFEGGELIMGADDRTDREKPEHKVVVKPFYLDKNLVTVSQFRKFIEATGYKTDAEKFGNSGVFDFGLNRWDLMMGAYWEYPLGPGKEKAKDDHPVTHVSWTDAVKFAEWSNKRLPAESEWEFAAKNGKNTEQLYSWGNKIYENGTFQANVWQGALNEQQGADGFVYTSPVGYYGELPSGLTDMGGNVWQWCSNTYKPYPGAVSTSRIDENLKVIRGGSFFYDEFNELSFTTTFRAFNTVETSLFNTGFRCARSE